MKNVKLDDGIFSGNTKQTDSKKVDKTESKDNKGTNKKGKKSKGVDFSEFANKNGIKAVTLEFEDKSRDRDYNGDKNLNSSSGTGPKVVGGDYKKPSYNGDKKHSGNGSYYKNTDKYSGEKKFYNNNSNGTTGKNYNNKKQFYPKRNFRTGNNKFDVCNMHLPKMMNMMQQPLYNPYTMNQGGMMGGYGNMMPNPNMNYFNPQGEPIQPAKPVDLRDTSDEAITEFVEAYLSLENLNADLYLRNRIDANGFIEVSEIANHNKLRSRGVTGEKIAELFVNKENLNVEALVSEDAGTFVRNRNFEEFKEKLYSVEFIQQQKRMNKSQHYMNNVNQMQNPMNMNYVSMQNNYFFNAMPNDQQMGMNMQAMNMGQLQGQGMNMQGMYQMGQGTYYPMMNTNVPQNQEEGNTQEK
jgi:hypothetical protein